jgi:flagellar basal-body rod protein FlgF
MDRMLYIAMNGAKHTMLAQAVNNQNLANVSTTGFRADLDAFRSQPITGPGYNSRAYASEESTGSNFAQGTIVHTGNELDVAIDGKGWIAVQAPDGSEAYTRAGDLKMTPQGQLLTRDNLPVLGNGGPIALPPADKIELGDDGTISVVPTGQAPSTLAVVDRIKLVNPPLENLHKGIDGLFHTNDGVAPTPDANIQVVTGALERSNVNAIEGLVNMIALAREYETHIKVMAAAKENDQASSQLLRLN